MNHHVRRPVLLLMLIVSLSGCIGHWDTLRYHGKETEISDADFRLDVGWNYLSDLDGDLLAQEARLRRMLIDEVVSRGECERDRIVDVRFGCLEGCGVHYVIGKCDATLSQ